MPSLIRTRWWWSMPPDRMRVALALYELALRTSPLVVNVHMLATDLVTSRTTVMRALAELQQLGFIHTKTTAGRTGGTEVILLIRDWFGVQFPEQFPAQLVTGVTAQDSEENQTAPQRAGQFPEQFPEQFQQPVLLDLPNPTKNSDPSPDLLRRTQPLPEEERTVPAPMSTPPNETTETNPQGKRPKIDPAKIPSPAWRAADGLRSQILKHNPEHKLGSVKWDDETTGMRLKWAHTFDLMNRVDRREWGEIGGVIRWLYPDDAQKGPTPAAAMFVIFSPDSLREKFDRVQAARKREHTGTSTRAPADTRQPPAFKSWGGGS